LNEYKSRRGRRSCGHFFNFPDRLGGKNKSRPQKRANTWVRPYASRITHHASQILFDMRENAVEFVEAVVFQRDAAFAFGAVVDDDWHTYFF
jgi:hypothetical protein